MCCLFLCALCGVCKCLSDDIERKQQEKDGVEKKKRDKLRAQQRQKYGEQADSYQGGRRVSFFSNPLRRESEVPSVYTNAIRRLSEVPMPVPPATYKTYKEKTKKKEKKERRDSAGTHDKGRRVTLAEIAQTGKWPS